jgi:acyl-CoA reductase-like NAD-dependent aldehyde dehydrogenase
VIEVLEPATAEVMAEIPQAGVEETDAAVARAKAAFPAWRAVAPGDRSSLLHRLANALEENLEELAKLEARNAGKPISDARGEMGMVVETFRYYAGAPERMTGRTIPVAGGVDMTFREPLGVVGLITPWNFPLTIASWKMAPALAAGNTIVLKPPSKDPLTMLTVAEIIEKAGVPEGAVSILPMSRTLGDRMVADERYRLLSFTGSPSVGWRMKERAGKKKVVLELGGNAGVIVDESADLDWAIKRILVGAFTYAGQVCISVQRMFIHRSRYDEFLERFVEAARDIKTGDPLDPETVLGPMVDEQAAQRTDRWVREAEELGGRVLLGGRAEGSFFPPTVLVDTPPTAQVCSNEAFAPLVVAFPFDDFDEAISGVNDSFYGLQTGVFTNDLARSWQGFNELEVGGVIVNDIPTYRIDNMPYGGVKDSGLGREGLRWAIEDMTEIRLMVVAQPDGPKPRPGE